MNEKEPIRAGKTDRGFAFVEFSDFYGSTVKIQKSSLAEYEALDIVLTMGAVFDPGLNNFSVLTRRRLRELLPILIEYAETGELPQTLKKASAPRQRKAKVSP